MTKPINTESARMILRDTYTLRLSDGSRIQITGHPAEQIARDALDEIDRLRADVAAMLPIVEAVAAISADHCCGLDCLHDDARRFLDARRK